MRIVEIIPSLKTRGGAETFFVDLSIALNKMPNVEIITVLLYSEDINDLYGKNLCDSGIKILTCKKKKGIDFSAARKLRKIIEEFNPNIVNTHLECLATYFLAFGSAKKPWKVFHTCHNIAKKETSFFNRVLRKIMLQNRIVTNIGISNVVGKTLTDYYGSKYFVPIINNGIKLRNNAKCDYDKKYDLICIGRFVEQKNQKFLIESLKHYYDKTGIILRCVFIGNGPTLEACKELTKRNGCDSYFTFTGSINDVYPYLLESKIFVLSSIYEGNPISILEAIDCFLPIISTDVGGVRDIVNEGKNGFLYKANDFDDFCRCIDAILDDKNYNQIKLNNCLLRKELSIEKTAEGYLELFYGNKNQ